LPSPVRSTMSLTNFFTTTFPRCHSYSLPKYRACFITIRHGLTRTVYVLARVVRLEKTSPPTRSTLPNSSEKPFLRPGMNRRYLHTILHRITDHRVSILDTSSPGVVATYLCCFVVVTDYTYHNTPAPSLGITLILLDSRKSHADPPCCTPCTYR